MIDYSNGFKIDLNDKLKCNITKTYIRLEDAYFISPTLDKTNIPPVYTRKSLMLLIEEDERNWTRPKNPTTGKEFGRNSITPVKQWIDENYEQLEQKRLREEEGEQEKPLKKLVNLDDLDNLECIISFQELKVDEAYYIKPTLVKTGLPPLYSEDALKKILQNAIDKGKEATDPITSRPFDRESITPLTQWLNDKQSTAAKLNNLEGICLQLQSLRIKHAQRTKSLLYNAKTNICDNIVTKLKNHIKLIKKQIRTQETDEMVSEVQQSEQKLIDYIAQETQSDSILAQHDGYKEILGNLLIALTGIGLFVLAGRYAICGHGFFATNTVNELNQIAKDIKCGPVVSGT